MEKVMMMNNKVLVKKIENENKTAAGIILTKESDERYVKVKVVQTTDEQIDIRLGDIALVDKYKLVEVNVDGATHICNEEDIVAIIME